MPRYHPIEPAQLEWDDTTPQSREHGDIYFSRDGGVEETHHVFLNSNDLPQRWQQRDSFTIAETGFGTGLNFLCAVDLWLKTAPRDARLHFVSVEKHPLTHHDLQRALSSWPQFNAISTQLIDVYPPLVFGLHRRELFDGRITLTLLFGDATEILSELHAGIDAWFLDGFAPSKNPQMWSEALFKQITRLTKTGGTFATFTAAGIVRRGLKEAGFTVETVPGFGRKRDMLRGKLAHKSPAKSKQPWFEYPAVNVTEKRAIVIGGGLAGTTVSHSLARRGWHVTLIERHEELAQEASGNHSGVILPRLTADMGCDGQFYLSAFLHTVQWLNELKKRDETLPWFASGVLQLEDEKRMAQLQRLSLPKEIVEFCDTARTSELSGITVESGGLFFPMAGWAEPPALCRWLSGDQRNNINTIMHQEALRLERVNGEWQAFNTEGNVITAAPVAIVANGYDAERLLGNDTMTLQKVRGQIAYTPATPQSSQLKTPICYDGYLIPAHKGLHCTGATYDVNNESTEIKKEDQTQIIKALRDTLPAFDAQSPSGGRTAFRTSTQDHLPIIGPAPDLDFYREHYHDLHHGKPAHRYPVAQYQPNLFVTTGHGSRGLVTCPMAANIIAAALNGETLPLPSDLLDGVHPARLMVRNLKRKP